MASPRRTGFFERRCDALGNRRAVGLEAVVARDHEELVAAHAHHEVRARDRIAQSSRDRTKIVVADRVAARIVDVLEVVAVDVKDGQRIAAARRLVDEARQLFVEEGAIRKARAAHRAWPGAAATAGVPARGARLRAGARMSCSSMAWTRPGAGIEVDDRELHVAPFVVAADELRRTALGRLVAFVAGAPDDTGVSKIVATSRRRSSSSDAPIRRCACGFASRTRREVGSNRHDAGGGAIEDRAVAGFADGRRRRKCGCSRPL